MAENSKKSLGEITEKLSVLKDYSSLIVPIVIALVGVVIFILNPILLGSKLEESIQSKSVRLGRQIESELGQAVPKEQWKIEKQYQDQHAQDANTIQQLAKQTSQREILSYRVLPQAPNDASTLIFKDFGQRYRTVIEDSLTEIRAGTAPTQAEIQQQLSSAGKSGSSQRRYSRSRGASQEVQSEIRNALCVKKAQNASVYVSPSELPGYDFWEEYEYSGMASATRSCWYWQVGYWIIQDVLKTADAINGDSQNVFESPLKRILYIEFGASDEPDTTPSYVTSSSNAMVVPCTGRYSNNQRDVVHFRVGLIVDSSKVMEVISEFCKSKQHTFRGYDGQREVKTFKHNQISILDSDILPIQRKSGEHQLYRYGENSGVVKLELVCEYLFNIEGYEPFKPNNLTAGQQNNRRR